MRASRWAAARTRNSTSATGTACSTAGIGELPADCRAAILSASLIYGEIGHQLRRDGGDSVNHRTVVSTTRKLMLLASAWTQAGWLRAQAVPLEPLEAIAYLVDGCAPHDGAMASRVGAGFPNRGLPQRVEWVFKLLERREHEKLQRGGAPVDVAPLH